MTITPLHRQDVWCPQTPTNTWVAIHPETGEKFITGNSTHSSPNLAQIPSDESFRKLFTAPDGWSFVGADLANIEVRILAHYLYPYDKGKYAEAVLSRDMHWYHAKLAGFWPHDDRDWPPDSEAHLRTPEMKAARTASKTFFFAFLYSAGDTVRGHTLWKDGCLPSFSAEEYSSARKRVEARLKPIEGRMYFPLKKDQYILYDESLILKTIYGKRIADTFLANLSGLPELIADCQSQSRTAGYLKALDGRLLYSRSPHSSLNLLLQGGAGIVAKRWGVNYHQLCRSSGIIHGTHFCQQAFIHDEYDCRALDDYAHPLASCLEAGAAQVTTDLSMNLPIKADAKVGRNWYDCH